MERTGERTYERALPRRFLRAGRGQGAQTPPPRPAPPPPLSSSATKSLTDADHFGMIRTAQRRFAPTVIGITRNSDRHQIGMSDRHRRNTQTDVNAVIEAAERLRREKDDVALELLVGMRERAIEQNPALIDNVDFEPRYEAETMGALDDLKALGRRILNRWNRELYGVVCGNVGDDQNARKAVLDSLNLSEAAVIAAVASALLSLGVAAAIAAALAPLIVRRFIWPAKDELCGAWGESLNSGH